MHILPCEEFGAAVSVRRERKREKEKMGHFGRGASLGNPLQSFFGHSNSAPAFPLNTRGNPISA